MIVAALVKFETRACMPCSLRRTGSAPVKTLASIALSLSCIESIKTFGAPLFAGLFPAMAGVGDAIGAAATKEGGGAAGLGSETGVTAAAELEAAVGVVADPWPRVGAVLGVADDTGGVYWLATGLDDVRGDDFAPGVCREGGELTS